MKIKQINVLADGMTISAEDDNGKPLTLSYFGSVDLAFKHSPTLTYVQVSVASRSGGSPPKTPNARFDAR